MAFAQKKFSNIRVYQIVSRFNGLAARNIVHANPALLSWSENAKRQYQSLNHLDKANSPEKPKRVAFDRWHFTSLDTVRAIEKTHESSYKTWQHCAFDILENLNKPTIKQPSEISVAWKTCSQILTSHNHFLKGTAAVPGSDKPTWQHAAWRIEKLNRTEKPLRETAWQVAYRAIMRSDLRVRRFGWYKAWIASKRLDNSNGLRV